MSLVLGINSAYHESSACLLRNGRLVAFIEEERLNRVRHAKPSRISNAGKLPVDSLRYCLAQGGVNIDDIDLIGFSLDPRERHLKNRNVENPARVGEGSWGTEQGELALQREIAGVPGQIGKLFGSDVGNRFCFLPHHLCHACSTFFQSGFESAAIIVLDGIGEFASTWVGDGRGRDVRNRYSIDYPDSLGFLWEKLSKFLGFGEYGAAKVMGLSSFGDESSATAKCLRSIVTLRESGTFSVDNSITRFRTDDFSGMEDLLGVRRRMPGEPITGAHQDIAKGLQVITNEVVLYMARHARDVTGERRLCMSGGVALNCVANNELLNSGTFEETYIEPTSNDAGTAIGAAVHLWLNQQNGQRPARMDTVYLGPEFNQEQVRSVLEGSGVVYERVAQPEKAAAKLLAQGNLVAWFQGAMEAGPRALGHRSILADPRRAEIKIRLDNRIKHREGFRPYGPSILVEKANEWLQIEDPAPQPARYMLAAFRARQQMMQSVPAVVHVDGTSRAQLVTREGSPRFWNLIKEFEEISGIPMVLNTSFNIDEPIVCTPQDALSTFMRSEIDFLVIDEFLVRRC